MMCGYECCGTQQIADLKGKLDASVADQRTLSEELKTVQAARDASSRQVRSLTTASLHLFDAS